MSNTVRAELHGRVRDLAHGGDAVVETDLGIVMARGALPGERVQVRVERKVRGVLRGTILAVVEASVERRAASCAIAEPCGGCPLMTLAEEAQIAWKQERLRRVLSQVGSAIQPEAIASSKALGYRVRARLAWRAAKGRAATIGYHAAASEQLVDVERCLVLAPAQQHGLMSLRLRLASLLEGQGQITLGPGIEGRATVDLASERRQPQTVYTAVEALAATSEIAGVALRAGRGGAPIYFGEPRQLVIAGDGQPLWSPPGSFVQANPEINALLASKVTELAQTKGARVLELYAGHGNLSIGLARGAESLRAVEASPEAAEAGARNLQERGLASAEMICADAAHGARDAGLVDVVVLDPPRKGAREALAQILACRPRRIVYVSCDPATLRRDLAELCAAGFAIDAAMVFDMFPQTAHMESVVGLVYR